MKICLVGPGIMPIPPVGWGAVEILIWDYKETLEKLGHEVIIINTRDQRQIIELCNSHNPDFVHVHYDVFWQVCKFLNCKKVAITSHYGYIDQNNKIDWDYHQIIKGLNSLNEYNTKIFTLSESNKKKFIEFGIDTTKIFVTPNAVRDDLFNFDENCKYSDKSIYLAKIEPRKRQYIFQNISSLYFAGNSIDSRFVQTKNYLGEWNKQDLYTNLTKYANLVLLSDGEAHPLVCMEAMVSGLGLVISEYCTANLDLNLPFIDVIPENKINDIEYVENIIISNRYKSIIMRNEIRKYAIDNFSFNNIIKNYIKCINEI
jgi:glycosyltransferase involved in cell wall biosynthesis